MSLNILIQPKHSSNMAACFQKESRTFRETNQFDKTKSIMFPSYQSSPVDPKQDMKRVQFQMDEKQNCQKGHPKVSVFDQHGLTQEIDLHKNTDNKHNKHKLIQVHYQKNKYDQSKMLTPELRKKNQILIKTTQKQWHRQIMFPSKQEKTIQKRLQQMLQQQTRKLARKTKYYTTSTQCGNTEMSQHFFDQTINSTSSVSKNSTLRKYLCEQSLNKCKSHGVKYKNKQNANSAKSSQKNSQKKVSCFKLQENTQEDNQDNKLTKEKNSFQKIQYLHSQILSIAKNIELVQGTFIKKQAIKNTQVLVAQIKNKINQILQKVIILGKKE